jgi:uncharacterized RDD family membrane protein YckC
MDGAAAAKAVQDWYHPQRPGIKQDDLLMREIPLLLAPAPMGPQPAPVTVRFKAVMVDGALMFGAVLAATLAATLNLEDMPSLQQTAMGALAALVILGGLYQVLFLILGKTTPGMKIAHIALRTFDDESPSRAQRCGRLGALALSLLPAGLGVLWAVVDRDHLSLHDRMSGTYLRKY